MDGTGTFGGSGRSHPNHHSGFLVIDVRIFGRVLVATRVGTGTFYYYYYYCSTSSWWLATSLATSGRALEFDPMLVDGIDGPPLETGTRTGQGGGIGGIRRV